MSIFKGSSKVAYGPDDVIPIANGGTGSTAGVSKVSLAPDLASFNLGLDQGRMLVINPGADINAVTINPNTIVSPMTVVADNSALRGCVYRNTDASKSMWFWDNANFILLQDSWFYRITARFRYSAMPVNANPQVYLGFTCWKDDRSTLVNESGSNTGNSQHYVAIYYTPVASTVLNQWYTITGVMSGRAAGSTAGTNPTIAPIANAPAGSKTFANPRPYHNAAVWATPTFIGNYNNAGGVVDLDYFVVEAIPPDLAALYQAGASAPSLDQTTTQVSFASGYSLYSSAFNPLTVSKTGTQVSFNGGVVGVPGGTVSDSTYTQFGTIPAGYRPPADAMVPGLLFDGDLFYPIQVRAYANGNFSYLHSAGVELTPLYLVLSSQVWFTA